MNSKYKPHDRYIRKVMSNIDVARDYLVSFLPPGIVKHLDFTRLDISKDSFITPALKDYFSDLIFECPYVNPETGEESLVTISLLFEHKFIPPSRPHLQLLRYMLEGYNFYLEKERKLNKGKKHKLRVIIPLIFYHGKDEWQVRPFHEYFAGMDENLKRFIPGFEYIFTNIADKDDYEILTMKVGYLKNALLTLKHSGEDDFIEENIALLYYALEQFLEEGDEYLKNFLVIQFVYLSETTKFNNEEIKQLFKKLPTPLKDLTMTTYENILEEGKKIGEKKLEAKLVKAILNLDEEGMNIDFIVRTLEVSKEYVIQVLKDHGRME